MSDGNTLKETELSFKSANDYNPPFFTLKPNVVPVEE